jgi:integrase
MDDEMANYPGLTQRGGVWHMRKRIPKDLEHIDTRGSIRISLGTKDKREAVREYHLKLAEIEAGFKRLRAELQTRPAIEVALATARIEDLGRQQIETLVAEWWQGRKPLREPELGNGMDRAEILGALAEDNALSDRFEVRGSDRGQDVADQLLVASGAAARPHRVGSIKTSTRYPTIDREATAYLQLVALVRQGLLFEQKLADDSVTGDRSTPVHPIFNPDGKVAPTAAHTVGDLVTRYRTERERLHGVESTARKYGLLFRVIDEQWEVDLPVSDISRERCVDLIDFIGKLPANGTKKFPKLTLAQSIEVASAEGHKRLAPNTVATYVQNLRAILRWGKRQKFDLDLDTEGLAPKGGAEVERRGLSTMELRTLFAGLLRYRENEPHKFWVPALAAYTGARAGEICQLRTEDVITINGILCLNLTRFDRSGRAVADKRFKNKNSERYVPLHEEIMQAGFVDFVETCDPDDRLFPALIAGPKGNYSHNFSKWFGRFMTRIALSDPSLVFHSFRHGFRDACRDADIPEETAHALGGWATINQGQRYGNRGAVPNLHRALQKISYGDFRLPVVPA